MDQVEVIDLSSDDEDDEISVVGEVTPGEKAARKLEDLIRQNDGAVPSTNHKNLILVYFFIQLIPL